MTNVWDRFETIVTPEEIKKAEDNTFLKLDEGNHFVELVSVEPAETQTGSPIAKFTFKDRKTNRKIMHSMFLTNMNYPEYTAREIVKVMNFLQDLTGKEYAFTSMGALANYIGTVEVGKIYEINAHYRTPETKYPEIKIVECLGTDYEKVDGEVIDEDLPF